MNGAGVAVLLVVGCAAALIAARAHTWRQFTAHRPPARYLLGLRSRCVDCDTPVHPGDFVVWRRDGRCGHYTCAILDPGAHEWVNLTDPRI